MRSSNGPSKLFVGEIGDNRKSDISRVFSKYGEISTIYIDEHKHFAFVEFTSSSDAKRALKHVHNKTVNGAKFRVEYAKSDKLPRDNRRPSSREHSPVSTLYNHLQVTANRLPSLQSVRQNYYQHPPSSMMSRGRSLTPPSFKQNGRLPSMNHLRTSDFYPPYYPVLPPPPPPHPPMYNDPAFYRTYGDPYLMQRLPPSHFLSATSPSRIYRNMYSSSEFDRHSSATSHRRKRQSRSRSHSRRRSPPSRKNRLSRERKHKRHTSISSQQQRERGPQTPPTPNRVKRRCRSNSNAAASVTEQKSPSSSSSSSSNEDTNDKQSSSRKSPESDSNRNHSKRKTKE